MRSGGRSPPPPHRRGLRLMTATECVETAGTAGKDGSSPHHSLQSREPRGVEETQRQQQKNARETAKPTEEADLTLVCKFYPRVLSFPPVPPIQLSLQFSSHARMPGGQEVA